MFNTEDIVPTVPAAAVQFATPNMGMHVLSPITQALSSFVKLSTVGYQHAGHPIAVTFHYDVVADNHSMDYLCNELKTAWAKFNYDIGNLQAKRYVNASIAPWNNNLVAFVTVRLLVSVNGGIVVYLAGTRKLWLT